MLSCVLCLYCSVRDDIICFSASDIIFYVICSYKWHHIFSYYVVESSKVENKSLYSAFIDYMYTRYQDTGPHLMHCILYFVGGLFIYSSFINNLKPHKIIPYRLLPSESASIKIHVLKVQHRNTFTF